ncbi:uncharacterized protein CLUP02_00556 [Colletotrichum lupini]|uniref:Uncharacterized protein n=1 Tax=Colletotrichum lupini TaxID=145971 RepID=A0A9Q8SAL5_9PEZI|nr:uncharacterized protein CLUP02_00556 [Colletotrichum lupini]UQC73909.1 hypothetical protein CLUP02_00556 [Colletotrichum lupini]
MAESTSKPTPPAGSPAAQSPQSARSPSKTKTPSDAAGLFPAGATDLEADIAIDDGESNVCDVLPQDGPIPPS